MNIADKILINEIKKQNREVFEELFKQYYPVLVKFAEGYLYDLSSCEDVVQSFFIAFWSNAEEINIKTSLKSYFFKSVKNLCLNKIRDLKVTDKHNLQYVESLFNAEEVEIFEDPELFEQIKSAIEILPPQMAEIFRQKYYEGKQIKVISEELNITDGTVKTQLHRARNTLRDILKESTNCTFFL